MSFTAKYKSDCEDCDEPVEPGQEARMVNFANQLVAHVQCPTPHSSRTEVACPSCFMTHAGECL